MAALNYLLFLEVPAPQSGGIVAHLASNFPAVKEAAGVYSQIDVIVYIQGEDKEIEDVIRAIENYPVVQKYHHFIVDQVCHGQGYNKGRFQRMAALFSFVELTVSTAYFDLALDFLKKIPEIRQIFPCSAISKIVVQIVTGGKLELDKSVMITIQQANLGISLTRTYITINNLHWADSGIPFTREEYNNMGDTLFPVFMSLSKHDSSFGATLATKILHDTQIPVWHFGLLKPAEKQNKEIKSAIKKAKAHIVLANKNFLESPACMGEWGNITSTADYKSICVLVLPPSSIEDLPLDFQERQCISCDRFYAYSECLEWIKRAIG